MHLLIIGGAGHLGSIVRPALEQAHTCRYMDIQPVAGAEDRTLVSDVNDDDALRTALEDIDAVLYMPLGVGKRFAYGKKKRRTSKHEDPTVAMNVNVLGLYRVFLYGLEMGIRRYVHTSTLSVYAQSGPPYPVDETRPPDAWQPYGLTKRISEEVCRAAAQHCPEASILALRLMRPLSFETWDEWKTTGVAPPFAPPQALGPRDAQRLYLKAIEFDQPGFYPIQAAGDVEGRDIPYQRALELIGWRPQGE